MSPESRDMALSRAKLVALAAAARKASQQAYCPYSRFRVGAAVLGESGAIAAGCNVENASYGLTICAERSALSQLIAQGETTIAAVLVYTPTPTPTTPCGACRQVLNEFGPNMDVICVCDGPDQIHMSLAELLPRAFGPRNLIH
jgi:cytidine deaminase